MRTSFCLFFCLAIGGCGVLPQREQPAGSCTQESDCSVSGQACRANQCVACSAHSDCASHVCDTYGDLGGASGSCVQPSKIIYADSANTDGPDCAIATGSPALPFCDLPPALDKLKQQPGLIIVLLGSPASYQLPLLEQSMGAVVLVGPGLSSPGKAATLAASTMNDTLQLGAGANVVIDGFGIPVDSIATAAGAKLTLRRSTISYMQHGAVFDHSTVIIDRAMFVQNKLGLSFDTSTVNITNSFITGNTGDPSMNFLDFNGGSGVFQFNTIAYNALGSSSAQVLNCVNAPGLMVKNSIFVQNGGAQQVASGCASIPNSLIVGKLDPVATQLKQDPAFENPAQFDLRLQKGDSTNAQYVFDKAVQVNPASEKNVDHDYFGTLRPQGAGYDVGAFELVAP